MLGTQRLYSGVATADRTDGRVCQVVEKCKRVI
jgi:hypothetical protein